MRLDSGTGTAIPSSSHVIGYVCAHIGRYGVHAEYGCGDVKRKQRGSEAERRTPPHPPTRIYSFNPFLYTCYILPTLLA